MFFFLSLAHWHFGWGKKKNLTNGDVTKNTLYLQCAFPKQATGLGGNKKKKSKDASLWEVRLNYWALAFPLKKNNK